MSLRRSWGHAWMLHSLLLNHCWTMVHLVENCLHPLLAPIRSQDEQSVGVQQRQYRNTAELLLELQERRLLFLPPPRGTVLLEKRVEGEGERMEV